ncbi:hypothetical protein P8C59_008548 [Phyllachora maydis]|uniref:Uncharacterized protein n=1 Tax=Phyllachora maydis TaxID=1825666 RepID=A0AAD9IAT9_9PEZI|nr:hypothetical protein P8C59_008548 [Phyllachora maydis]
MVGPFPSVPRLEWLSGWRFLSLSSTLFAALDATEDWDGGRRIVVAVRAVATDFDLACPVPEAFEAAELPLPSLDLLFTPDAEAFARVLGRETVDGVNTAEVGLVNAARLRVVMGGLLVAELGSRCGCAGGCLAEDDRVKMADTGLDFFAAFLSPPSWPALLALGMGMGMGPSLPPVFGALVETERVRSPPLTGSRLGDAISEAPSVPSPTEGESAGFRRERVRVSAGLLPPTVSDAMVFRDRWHDVGGSIGLRGT